MMKRIFAGFLILLLFMFGCGGGGADGSGDLTSEVDSSGDLASETETSSDEDEFSDSSNITISFSLDSNSLSLSLFKDVTDLTDNEPNELIYCTLEDRTINRVQISNLSVEVELPKDDIYLFALVYNPTLDGITGQKIEVIGGIHVGSGELIALPVSADSENSLDLGELSYSENAYESDVSLEEISAILGIDADVLDQFGKFKSLANHLLNPDINQNGLYDQQEEDLNWDFRSVNAFFWYPTDFYNLQNHNDADVLERIESSYSHTFNIGYWYLPHDGDNGTILEYCPGATSEECPESEWQRLGQVDDMFDDVGSTVDPDGSQTYCFNNEVEAIDGELGPWDGSYRMVHIMQTYYFYNMRFNKPYKDDSLLIFPFFAPVDNGTEYYDTIEWEWKGIHDGTIIDVFSDVIQMIMEGAAFGVEVPGVPGPASELGSYDLLNVEGTVTFDPPISILDYQERNISIGVNYLDYGSTQYTGFNGEPIED